jgi:hypothetical protein
MCAFQVFLLKTFFHIYHKHVTIKIIRSNYFNLKEPSLIFSIMDAVKRIMKEFAMVKLFY